ncbi:sensor histidine kinase [Flavobacteriaceae bacterium S356]|uniref:Sensor histidine kinase n=1 Tax=Asprobacillus argus TaxID=3076534 RepID=A0ABU3LD54_9FLAO|nr:sensor histidine kinase [Flavobacteriaceae bacterium S356]
MNDNIWAAADFSLVQTLFLAVAVYVNLLILIPKLLVRYGSAVYIIGVAITLISLSFLVMFSGSYNLLNDMSEGIGDGPEMSPFMFVLEHVVQFSLFIIISFLYWYFNRHKEEEEKALQFSNDKLQAELQALKSQISPHFLFNSLNNIYSLSILNHSNAPIMIEKLSDILHYLIYEGKHEEVALADEIQLIENYIQLQLLRKLKNEESIHYRITGDFSNKKIAPLLLINIIENGFKHSNISSEKNGFLKIRISTAGNTLTVLTENTFTPNDKKKGIGLQNLEQQLEHMYPKSYSLKVNNKNRIFRVELTLELD